MLLLKLVILFLMGLANGNVTEKKNILTSHDVDIGYHYKKPVKNELLLPVPEYENTNPNIIQTQSTPSQITVTSESTLQRPLILTLYLGTLVRVPSLQLQDLEGSHHKGQTETNPYITVLLSQYGRYLPVHVTGQKGLYFHAASNNYHNNKPFGSYKVHADLK